MPSGVNFKLPIDNIVYLCYHRIMIVNSKSGSMADVNPFRYRGYYYDEETGFYYLRSRYYDPSTRMFINANKSCSECNRALP